jgi:heat shock protein HtpX
MPFETDRNWRRALGNLHASANLIQAVVLPVAFGVLVALAAWPLIGAVAFLLAGLAIAAIAALALRLPPRVVMRLYGARLHERGALKQVDALVAELAERAALVRCPVLYVVPSTLLSAFSVATEHTAAIAVTEGLLRRLTMREIAAVLAREIAHVGLGDLPLLGIADVVTRFAQALYYLGLGLAALNLWRLLTGDELVSWWTVALLILAPALLNLLQLRLPRTRDYAADRAAALMTGDPLGLASAISRLETSNGSFYDDLIPPVPARRVPQPSMLRCPPPAEQRIERLRALEAPPMPPLDIEEGPRISLVGVGPIEMRPRYRWPGVWF